METHFLMADARIIVESIYYFCGVHYLKNSKREIVIYLTRKYKLHCHGCPIKHRIFRALIWTFALPHQQLVNALGLFILCLWLSQDFLMGAHWSLFALDSARVGLGLVAIRAFNDYM